MSGRYLIFYQVFNFKKDPECAKIWSKIEDQLGNILRKTAEICFKKGKLTETERERYFVSGTVPKEFNDK